jgi:undecaprenyl-diphosphatase
MPRTQPPPGFVLAALAGTLRAVGKRLRDLRAAAGLVLVAGALGVAAGIALFAWVAVHVRTGHTQAFDDAVLRFLAVHRGAPWLQNAMLETTLLGTGTVVIMIAGEAALFLALTHHRASATLLHAATVGALVLNNVLKAAFDRPRPQLFTWGTRAYTTSFPSGHAMSAAAVYATIAFLAARLQRRRGARVATYAAAAVVILAISFSRHYLGVHNPIDVGAGIVVGLAWAAFCATVLEAVQLLVRRPRHGDRRAMHASPPIPESAGLADQAADPTSVSNIRS